VTDHAFDRGDDVSVGKPRRLCRRDAAAWISRRLRRRARRQAYADFSDRFAAVATKPGIDPASIMKAAAAGRGDTSRRHVRRGCAGYATSAQSGEAYFAVAVE
jgi:hypothetical protein